MDKDGGFQRIELKWADDIYFEGLAAYFDSLLTKFVNGEYDIPEIQRRLNFQNER